VISLLIIVFLNSCDPSANASAPGDFPVDPTFSDFYRGFGGTHVLGPAISPAFQKEGVTYQYTVAGLMVYDPAQLALKRFIFSPIASTEWNINDLTEPSTSVSDYPSVNGHRIWEEVLPFYEHYSLDVIGLPVTSVKANDEKQRYEQYFEGVGFFRNYMDAPGQVHLLPYGSWMCGSNCQYRLNDSDPPEASYARQFSETEQIFLQESERLGFGFTGSPLTPPQMGEDGNYEMVFENVILYIDPADGNQLNLRPLPSWLGIQSDRPTLKTEIDGLTFYHVNADQGYNVPNVFADYIARHGNMVYSGFPITEYKVTPDSGYSQCFTNICLEYHPTAPEQLRIRPHALGIEYLRNGLNTTSPDDTFTDALQIDVWEQFPLIPSGQVQVINIKAIKNALPITGIELSLIVKHPDGIVKSYRLTPTGEDGTTSIELDPINGPNGSIIQYQVCIIGQTTPQVCFSRSYSIWNQ